METTLNRIRECSTVESGRCNAGRGRAARRQLPPQLLDDSSEQRAASGWQCATPVPEHSRYVIEGHSYNAGCACL